jgi:hypothetical protein
MQLLGIYLVPFNVKEACLVENTLDLIQVDHNMFALYLHVHWNRYSFPVILENMFLILWGQSSSNLNPCFLCAIPTNNNVVVLKICEK